MWSFFNSLKVKNILVLVCLFYLTCCSVAFVIGCARKMLFCFTSNFSLVEFRKYDFFVRNLDII